MGNELKSYLDGLMSSARAMHQSEDWAMSQIAHALARREAAAADIVALGMAIHARQQPLQAQPAQQQVRQRNDALEEALLRDGD